MTWSSGSSRDAIAADTLFFFSLWVNQYFIVHVPDILDVLDQPIEFAFKTYLGYVRVTIPVSLVP